MRAKGFLIAGLVALIVGIVGLIVSTAIAAPSGFSSWDFGMGPSPERMMGMSAMMGGPVAASATPIGIERAGDSVRNYIASSGNPNLALDEVMEFGANYYAQVIERDTGVHAFELLIDKYSGAVFPEMGPNMVWNTKYGMMGWRRSSQSAEMPIGPDKAQELARQYLKTQGLPLDVAEPDHFYGYYTLHTVRRTAGDIEGMLSVNGYNGEVWYHAWHGPFIQMQDFQAGASGGGR
ncbi:MAG: hypothetical protein M1358_09190 [Chloroflexi bacterium]|nr:hypothetical protein [Chloroflexota bacterium]